MSFHDKHIIVLTHVLTTVPAKDLEKFLLQKKVNELLIIGQPLFYMEGRPGPHYTYYKQGKVFKEVRYRNKRYPMLVQYTKDFFLSLGWILKTRKRWDIIVGIDNLNTLVGLLLRKIGMVNQVIYYTIDFVPNRFSNRYLNKFYHKIDLFCVLHADITWNVSPRFVEGRETIQKQSSDMKVKQITLPIGVWLPSGKRKAYTKNPHTLVYAGGLAPHQGVQLMLEAMPDIIKKIPSIRVEIIGIGQYKDELMQLAKTLRLQKSVSFLGYFEKHEDVEKILAASTIGVALYNKSLDKWSSFADPSKIKSYLAAGLPVITTDVTHIASELEKQQCGIVVPYTKEAFTHAVIDLLLNPSKYRAYCNNACEFINDYDWNRIFTDGFTALQR